jgi:hypothetical protein
VIHRLALLVAALAGVGALAAPVATAEQAGPLPKTCVWVRELVVCAEVPLGKVP